MTPETSPVGRLIRLARNAAGLSAREAARRAGVSETHWRNVEKGEWSSSAKLAPMARVVNISPGRLEAEGQRPDAAEVLREIIRQEQDQPPVRGRPRFPDDPEMDALAEETWNRTAVLPDPERRGLIEAIRRQRQDSGNRNSQLAASLRA